MTGEKVSKEVVFGGILSGDPVRMLYSFVATRPDGGRKSISMASPFAGEALAASAAAFSPGQRVTVETVHDPGAPSGCRITALSPA